MIGGSAGNAGTSRGGGRRGAGRENNNGKIRVVEDALTTPDNNATICIRGTETTEQQEQEGDKHMSICVLEESLPCAGRAGWVWAVRIRGPIE